MNKVQLKEKLSSCLYDYHNEIPKEILHSFTLLDGKICPEYKKDLEHYLRQEIKTKTRLNVKVKKVIFAKTYPEKRKFLSIYYFCEVIDGKEKAGEKFVEIKWIKPTEVRKYFTTSLHPKVWNFLKNLK